MSNHDDHCVKYALKSFIAIHSHGNHTRSVHHRRPGARARSAYCAMAAAARTRTQRSRGATDLGEVTRPTGGRDQL